MGHAERKHSLLGPSSAHRWMTCTPSAMLEQQFPDDSGEAAAEGTLAHELAEQKLKAYFYPQDVTMAKLTRFITKCKKDALWNNEMLEHTDAYVDYIKNIAIVYDTQPYVTPEKEYDLTRYVAEEGAHGTADCTLISNGDLHVFDFKYGKGVRVDAVGNPQLQLYALGAYEAYKLLYRIDRIHMHIIQPRIDNYSSWEISLDELLAFGEEVKRVSALAIEGAGSFAPSTDACRFCRAKSVCRARADKNIEMAFMKDTPVDTIELNEIQKYLKAGEDVARWLEDLKDYALSQCLAGKDVEGYKAVEGRGSRDWTNMDDAFRTLINSGIDETVLYERKPLTLAAIEKLLGKKAFGDAVGDYVVKKPGKPTLVEASDKRSAVTNTVSAKDVFQKGDNS